MGARPYYLSPLQMYALLRAVEPVNEAFDECAYLVGSVLDRPDYRDVDVRLILDDDEFERFFGAELDQHHGHATALWMMLATMISRDLASQTGLNIDFQIQAKSVANKDGGPRNALFLPPHVLALRTAPTAEPTASAADATEGE